MIIENLNNSKKQYQPPCLEVIQLDNHIALEAPSDGPITEPGDGESPFGVGRNESDYYKTFPTAPASDNNPFGGSSPNYK